MSARDILAVRIHEARLAAGRTQTRLAAVTGLDATAISHFETGRRTPCARNLRTLCVHLNVSADWLLGLDGNRRRL